MGRGLAKLTHAIRRWLATRHGLLWALGASILLGLGFFAAPWFPHAPWLRWAVGGVSLGLVLKRLLLGRPARASRLTRAVDQIETGLGLLSTVYIGLQLTGGPSSPLQPAAYLSVAYLVGVNERPAAAVLTLAALGLQGALHFAAGDLPGRWTEPALRGGAILLFAGANIVLLQLEVQKRRRDHDRRLAAEIRALRDEARDFRLISSSLASGGVRSRPQEESKLARGAVEAIHQQMYFVLEMLKKSLELQTCVLLWLDGSGERLRIKELVTDSTLVTETPIPAQAGALGGVVKNRLLLNLRRPRQGAKAIPYYAGPEEVGAFAGVPVLENGHLRGVLCADRRSDRPFTEMEEELLVEATRQILRAIQTERVFCAVERAKFEHERFYRASAMLNGALTLAQVYDTAFSAAQQIVEFDFAAVTLHDRQRGVHTICRVYGDDRETLEGQEFGDNAGLVAMVVKNKHFLPAGDGPRERDAVVFTRKLRIGSTPSLVVLPLIVHDNAVGTFVLASRSESRFPKEVREMLGVITNQVAVSIENAKMYKRMEEMATTDGLTGLPNHRTFQARFAEMLQRAERHGKPISLILTDVDKFKSVNDTYGHPVGDQVLRRVAGVLAEQVRRVDLAARYGGEEFAIVLEETDSAGARLLCERIREQMAAQVMSSEKGPFRVTVSLGVASYPADGREKETLVERADQALYQAKESGRNRTVRYAEMRGARAHAGAG